MIWIEKVKTFFATLRLNVLGDPYYQNGTKYIRGEPGCLRLLPLPSHHASYSGKYLPTVSMCKEARPLCRLYCSAWLIRSPRFLSTLL
jgi:hypothetical protein